MSYSFVDSLRAGSGRNQFRPDPARKLSANPYVLLCVQRETPWWWTEGLSEHVEFYSKNKSEKLVHLFRFIIRIYHDAWSQNIYTELPILVSQMSDSMAFCPQCAPVCRNVRFLRWRWRLVGLWMLCRAVRQTYADASGSSAASFRLRE